MTGTEGTLASSHSAPRATSQAKFVRTDLVAGGSLVLAGLTCAAGCASLAPLAVKWGADLVSTAANNYSQQYSHQLQDLLLAVYSDQATKRLPGQGAGGSGQGAYPPYGSQAQPYPADPNYAQQSPGGSAAPSGSPYPVQAFSSSGSQPAYGTDAPSPYPQTGYPAATSPVVLDVAILAQRASDRAARRTEPAPIQDGETLRDGGGDPRKGDVVKFTFRTNCDCHVYVIAVDATGYVARVFPEKGGNPVRANRQYVVPQGSAWYGLDEYKGTEQIFFLASRQPRADIENSLRQLAKTDRSSLSRSFRPVREAALPDPATRGLVKVQMGTKSTVSSESGQQYAFTPQAFAAQPGTDDVVVTRWFRHE
jgi:uncharacterized protein DUF4384